MTTSTTYSSVQLGAWVRYHATPKLSLFTGTPGLPTSSVGISTLAYPLPPFQYQLAVGLNAGSAITLQVPLGASFQVSPSLFAYTGPDLTERIGELVLSRTLEGLNAWDAAGLAVPRVGVNFAPAPLYGPRLVEQIKW